MSNGPEVVLSSLALSVFDEEPLARSIRGVSRTNFRNCWLFIGKLALTAVCLLSIERICAKTS